MPGYQRKFVGQPPAPPHWCAVCMGQESTEGVEYFIETGAYAEEEGVIYLCNKCFEPLVMLSEKFVSIKDHEESSVALNSAMATLQAEHQEMSTQAHLLHELFGLRLSDLTKFSLLTNKLDHLYAAVGEMEAKKEQRSARELIEQQEVSQRHALITSLDAQIEIRKAELNVYIEDSLTTKLEHIGRADLIPILLNNQLSDSVTKSSDGDEREADEDSGESNISGVFNFSSSFD